MRRRKGNPVDGVLLLDKPAGITSNAALQSARRMLNAAKGGHTGTLDPMATGLLPLCFGEATKFSGLLLDASKTYLARIAFGSTTTTGDAEGEVLERFDATGLDCAQVVETLNGMVGGLDQVPPMYSALKHQGRPLYEYARAGEEVERASRAVQILSLEVLAVAEARAEIRVRVSKGTYIRSLAEEAGRRIGCGAHLAALRREAVASFGLEAAVTLEQLDGCPAEQRPGLLLPPDALVGAAPRIDLDDPAGRAMRQGRTVSVTGLPAGLVRMYDSAGSFIGVGRATGDGSLMPQRLLQTAG